jgi:RHS repeat-associated protein
VQTLDYTASVASPCINTSSPLITRHLMAGAQTLEETVHCTLAAGGSGELLVREFVWGDRFPEPVAMITHGGLAGPSAPAATSVYYYLPDILGSVLALADAAGNLVERYSYDPYGKTLIERHESGGGWTATAASSFGNPFAWTGQRYDAPVGLYHFLFRSYSPTLGRWLQRDPAGYVDGVGLHEYVAGSPIEFVDPDGQSFGSWCAKATGKKVFKVAVKKFIKEAIKDRLKGLTKRKLGKLLLQEADELIELLDNETWIEWLVDLIPIAGDAYTIWSNSKKLREIIRQLDELEERSKQYIEALRKKGVNDAWHAEREWVKSGNEGSRPWTPAERKELIETGKVTGYVGHHINSVKKHPELADNQRNVEFKKPGEHLDAHDKNWGNQTSGPLIDRPAPPKLGPPPP